MTNEQKRLAKDEVKNALEFQFTWTTSGFGTVLMLDITIGNPTPHEVKDLEIRCGTFGASGTRINDLRQTVYEVVKPYRTTEVKQVNMGFVNQQTAIVRCIISDFVLVAS